MLDSWLQMIEKVGGLCESCHRQEKEKKEKEEKEEKKEKKAEARGEAQERGFTVNGSRFELVKGSLLDLKRPLFPSRCSSSA